MTQIRKTFLIEDNDVEIIKDCMNQVGISSQSEFIRLLIRNFNESRDIEKDLRTIDFEKNELLNKIKNLEDKEKELKETSKIKEKENIEKEDQIKKVIELLKRKIKEGKTIIELKDCAKYWAFKLGIGVDSLVAKANKEIEDEKT
jgi:histidyl-tRNA synthetase